MFGDILEHTEISNYLLCEKKNERLIQYGNTDDFVLASSVINNRRINVVQSAISQISQVNARSAVNKEIARCHNFDVISKIIKRKYIKNSRAKKNTTLKVLKLC